MGIARMMSLGAQRTAEQGGLESTAAADENRESGGAKQAVASAMEQITAFVPSEVIGIYVAGVGILTPQSDRAKWLIFAIALLLIPAFMGLAYLLQKKRNQPVPTLRTSLVVLVMALVAFVAWAAALPATPFLAVASAATNIGGWAVIILALVMPKLAELLDVVPIGGKK